MPFKIVYLDAKGLIGTDSCSGSLARAKEIADKALDTKMADIVEVRDDSGAIVYRCPGELNRP